MHKPINDNWSSVPTQEKPKQPFKHQEFRARGVAFSCNDFVVIDGTTYMIYSFYSDYVRKGFFVYKIARYVAETPKQAIVIRENGVVPTNVKEMKSVF